GAEGATCPNRNCPGRAGGWPEAPRDRAGRTCRYLSCPCRFRRSSPVPVRGAKEGFARVLRLGIIASGMGSETSPYAKYSPRAWELCRLRQRDYSDPPLLEAPGVQAPLFPVQPETRRTRRAAIWRPALCDCGRASGGAAGDLAWAR